MDFSILHLNPIAFSLGSLAVRWYALAYLAGFVLGWQYCLARVRNKQAGMRPNEDDIDNFLTWAVIGVLIGGRMGYVLFYQPAYYMLNPAEIYKIWNGGMSFHGGVLGVMLAMLGYAYKHKFNVLLLSDVVCMAAPIGLFFGRIANFINAELYGRVTTMSWGVIFPGETMPRHPSQLYEALFEGVILFLILYFLSKREKMPAGFITGAFLCGYGVFRAGIEFFREPDVNIGLMADIFSMGQILCLPMIIAGMIFMYYSVQKAGVNDKGKSKSG